MHVGVLTLSSFTRSGPPRSVVSLHPCNVGCEVPMRENHAQVPTFLNQFVKARGNYPATDFLTPGLVCSFKQAWWSSLMMYMLEVFEADLKRLGLYQAVRATLFGINICVPTLYVTLEMYYPASGTLFTLLDEQGMALHEMWEVSNLPMGSKPYEKCFPCTEELALIGGKPHTKSVILKSLIKVCALTSSILPL